MELWIVLGVFVCRNVFTLSKTSNSCHSKINSLVVMVNDWSVDALPKVAMRRGVLELGPPRVASAIQPLFVHFPSQLYIFHMSRRCSSKHINRDGLLANRTRILYLVLNLPASYST